MPIVAGPDLHRKQVLFDYLDTMTGEVRRGQVRPADRLHLRAWLARFVDRADVLRVVCDRVRKPLVQFLRERRLARAEPAVDPDDHRHKLSG